MLTSLHIQNFAIVSSLELDFSNGMTAFTGETGAGKSIMIDALMLALGERADSSVIRLGAEKCEITVCFEIATQAAPAQWLLEHDVSLDENRVVLRRVLYVEGRSKSTINGIPFPLQKIKALSALLVDIHGQHQHQTLLHHSTHREQLDLFARHTDLLASVEARYQTCQAIKQELLAIETSVIQEEKKALLVYQREELTQLDIKPDEIETLNKMHHLLRHAQDYLDTAELITQRLTEQESFSVQKQLNQILQWLATFPEEDPAIQSCRELINSALIQSDEAQHEINRFMQTIELDPERLEQVEQRLSDLHQLARKYRVEPHALSEYKATLDALWDALHAHAERKAILEQQLHVAEQVFENEALALRQSRKKAAEKLCAEITTLIQQLGMPKGSIEIQLSPLDHMQPHGLDRIEYLVCTNPGLLPNTLAKIASGGELSRIGLAIHMITAQRGATPTLLFDEVDVGIGGATAALVGKMLRALGDRLQLFCVTHQPQVAAAAHHQFKVEKETDDVQTYSNIVALTANERVDEIARMLGGLTITAQTRAHAEEMLGCESV